MCVPVRFTGDNFRQETAQRKMESMKVLMGAPQSRKALQGEEEQGSERSFPLQRETKQSGLCDDEITGWKEYCLWQIDSSTTTAADKMARVLEAEAAATQEPTYPA